MREIKFRAWIGDRKALKEVVRYEKHDNGFSVSYLDSIGDELAPIYSNSHSIKLMQYTGLKDKNGIEIYEGDVMVLNKLKPSYYVVKYKENGFVLDGVSLFENAHYFTEREIIGNIYEHNHLLDNN